MCSSEQFEIFVFELFSGIWGDIGETFPKNTALSSPTVDKFNLDGEDMKSKTQHRKILEQYPEYINKEQLYKICRISKRTALYLLESGLIPCVNSGKQTRKYTVATQDVVEYLIRRDKEPERYLAPMGWYQDKSKNDFIHLSPELNRKMRCYFEQLMETYPDVLSVQQVAEITGYKDATTARWCSCKKLYHFCISGKFKIPKVSLLEFMMSVDLRGIRTKSEKHRKFIEYFQQRE